MKIFNILFLFILFAINSNFIFTIDLNIDSKRAVENVVKNKFDLDKKNKKTGLKNIDFNFKDVDLIDVINMVAAEKYENIVLPVGQDSIKSKLTIETPEKLTIDEAWDLLNTILDVAGYAVSLSAGDMLKIVKKDDNLTKNPFRIFKEEQEQSRIFVGTDYEKIPDTDERITFIGYFENIQVPNASQSGGGDSQNVIQEVIQIYTGKNVSSTSDRGTSSFRFIPEANGIIIVDKSSNIRSMMKIFSQLDKAGFKEHIEKIKLEHVSSENVAKMFNDENTGIIGKKQKTTYRLGKKRKSKSKYFDKETKVVSESKSNSVILLGNKEAIDRIKEFIYRFVDIPIEGGRSVLHRIKLDYLDCDKLREVLLKIVSQTSETGSQATAGAQGAGPERFFQEVRIETDRPKTSDSGEAEKGKYKYSGTNSLLIAASNEDFNKIKELVAKIDTPSKSVIVEVLIVDLTMDGNRVLGSQTRNPALAPLFNISRDGNPINAQSAQLAGLVTSDCAVAQSTPCLDKPKTLRADLMQGNQSEDPKSNTYNPFISPTAGSTLFTLNDKDGSTWSILKVLELYHNTKILSHPYIVAVNNKPAVVKVGFEKVIDGDAQDTSGGAVRVIKAKVNADIEVNVTPRIGGVDVNGDSSVNLQIGIGISEFRSDIVVESGTNPRITRNISTAANLKSGEILVLGGLIRNDSSNSEGKTPILGSIPIIGWFFKSRASENVKTNLTVFIRATAVEPELRGKMDAYTKDYIAAAKKCSEEGGLFEGLRDPVTRWFFGANDTSEDRIDSFMSLNEKIISTEELHFSESKVGDKINMNFARSELQKDFAGDMQNKQSTKVASSGKRLSRGEFYREKVSSKAKTGDTCYNLSSGDLCNEEIACTNLPVGELSQVNSYNYDLANKGIKENRDIANKNSYELFEDDKQEDLLASSGACPVIIGHEAEANNIMNNNIVSKDEVNILLTKNKEYNNYKSNVTNSVQSSDKLRDLLNGVNNPFVG